jgi:hypothetical protein
VSISPILYMKLFHLKVFCVAFVCLQFGFVYFWRKDLGTKAAHKMLMKLAPGLQKALFTNRVFLQTQNAPAYFSQHR